MNKQLSLLALLATAATLSAQTNIAKPGSSLPTPEALPHISQRASATSARPNLTIVTTNHVLISGTLVSQSATNMVVSSFGMNISIPREQIKWCETNLINAVGSPAPAAAATATPAKSSASIIAEFNKPHTEDEMRGLLQTPEGQELVKDIADSYIGAGMDTATSAARESYLNMVQQFQSGGMGVAEIQGQAQDVLGQLGKYDKELNNDPNAEEWKEYKEILQGFVTESPPAPADQMR